MSFTGLIVGLYQVNVEASDASTKVIFVGSSEVEIEYNTNKSILIQLDYATGDITIGFTFPTEEPTIEPTAIPTPTAEPTIEPTAEPTVTPVPTNVTVEKIGTEHIVTIPISNQDFTVEIYYNEDPFPPMLPRTDFFVGIDLNASIPDIDPGDTITFRVEFLNPLMVNRNDVPYIAFSLGCTYAGCMIPSYEYNIIPDGNIALSVGNAGCYMTCPAETGTIDGFWFNMNTTQEPLIEGAILNGFTASFIVPTTLAHENGTTCLSSITCSTVYQSDERSNPLPFVLLD